MGRTALSARREAGACLQERALRTTVVYAAHPFKRYTKLGMSGDGLRCVGDAALETVLLPSEVPRRRSTPPTFLRLTPSCFYNSRFYSARFYSARFCSARLHS